MAGLFGGASKRLFELVELGCYEQPRAGDERVAPVESSALSVEPNKQQLKPPAATPATISIEQLRLEAGSSTVQ